MMGMRIVAAVMRRILLLVPQKDVPIRPSLIEPQ